MDDLAGNLFTLLMLFVLQAVLGFDNLLYISIESGRVPEASQKRVRQIGILLAIALRIVLLFVVVKAIDLFQDVLFTIDLGRHPCGGERSFAHRPLRRRLHHLHRDQGDRAHAGGPPCRRKAAASERSPRPCSGSSR